MNDMVNKCYSCDFHRQDCTFTLTAGDGPTKKRKLSESARDDSAKRYADAESPVELQWRWKN
jgi:hypothetical protein